VLYGRKIANFFQVQGLSVVSVAALVRTFAAAANAVMGCLPGRESRRMAAGCALIVMAYGI
jgi:hypothetical protein